MSKYFDDLIKQKQEEIQRLVEMNNKTGKGKGMGIAGSATRTVKNECTELRRYILDNGW